MRSAVLLFAVWALAGCTSLVRQNGDYFEAAGKDPARFEADAQACHERAATYVSYDLRAMDGTGYARNRAFNTLYRRCMTDRGYAPRAYIENLLPG